MYLDFDKMMREIERTGPVFRVFGEDVALCELPAKIVLKLVRSERDSDVPPELLVEAAEAVFGKARLEAWLDRPDFTLNLLSELLRRAFRALGGGEEPAEDSPKNV